MRWLGVAFFAVETVRVAPPEIRHALVLGPDLTGSVDAGDAGRIDFNLFALAMAAWSLLRAPHADRAPAVPPP